MSIPSLIIRLLMLMSIVTFVEYRAKCVKALRARRDDGCVCTTAPIVMVTCDGRRDRLSGQAFVAADCCNGAPVYRRAGILTDDLQRDSAAPETKRPACRAEGKVSRAVP